MKKQDDLSISGRISRPRSWETRKAAHWGDTDRQRRKRAIYLITFVIIALAMFIVVSVVFSAELNQIDKDEAEKEANESEKPQCLNYTCNVTYSGRFIQPGSLTNLQEFFNHSEIQKSCRAGCDYRLMFRDVIIPNFTLSEGWLPTSDTIKSLQIRNTSLTLIQRGAFKGNHFTGTEELVLDANDISTLTKGAFEGLTSLKYLAILNSRNLNTVHIGVLSPLSHTLESIRVQNTLTKPELIQKLTGNVKMFKLETIDFSFNSVNYLKSGSFSGLVKAKAIYLNDCELKAIGYKILDIPIGNLLELNLNNNKLSSLTKSSFRSIFNNETFIKVIV